MNLMKLTKIVPIAAALALGACSKEDKTETPVEEPTETAEAEAEPVEEPEPAEAEEPAAEETADFIVVEATHAEPKPDDPVKVSFPVFKVVKASFDPANLEGGSAELEINLAKVDSGIPKRDTHLMSPDYFDVEKHPVAKVLVTDVKKKDEDSYTAKAEVTVHGVTQTWPVEFDVVATTDTSVTVEAEHAFKRMDFKVGNDKDDGAADEMKLGLRLTLEKSA